MEENSKSKIYDLEARTFQFAKLVRELIRQLPKSTTNFEDAKQLARSSGSVGANYIEANESLGKKDFLMKIKISRKEAKESIFWLNLLDCNGDSTLEEKRVILMKECTELMMIFGSIIRKSV